MTHLPFDDERRCKGPCGKILSLSEFEPQEKGRGGRRSTCAECRYLERNQAPRGPATHMPGLRATREAMGLSRAQLARMVSVDRSTIHNIENGHSKASGHLAKEIMAALVNLRRHNEGRHEFQASTELTETLA